MIEEEIVIVTATVIGIETGIVIETEIGTLIEIATVMY